MKNIFSIKIIIIGLLLKFSNLNKTLAILAIYKILKYIIIVIFNSVNRVIYEDTIIGKTKGTFSRIHFKYVRKIKSIVYYSLFTISTLISVFKKYVPVSVLTFLGVSQEFNILSFLLSMSVFFYKLTSDLLNRYCK